MAADAVCPWIAEPTAAGLLGGPVQVQTSDESCEFSRPQHALRIEVHRMNDPKKDFARYVKRCGKKASPIKGIGNEAFACTDRTIVGRVRDMAFQIHITAPSDAAEMARKAAEQVAGALF
jgi:hypothetical protein